MADLCYFVYMPGMEIKGLMFRKVFFNHAEKAFIVLIFF